MSIGVGTLRTTILRPEPTSIKQSPTLAVLFTHKCEGRLTVTIPVHITYYYCLHLQGSQLICSTTISTYYYYYILLLYYSLNHLHSFFISFSFSFSFPYFRLPQRAPPHAS